MGSINKNWTDENEMQMHQGGVSTGIGFTISVLPSCREQLAYYQNSAFSCNENAEAYHHFKASSKWLKQRRDRRQDEGTLGTHNV